MDTQLTRLSSILIIDDNEIDIFLQERVLEKSGLCQEIISFISPHKALDYLEGLLQQEKPLPELILLDINMPGMSGFQLLDHFNSIPGTKESDSRFIIVTSSESMSDFEKAFSYSNVVSFKVKPLSIEDVTDFPFYFNG